jgi:hypothetical protein
MATYDAAKLFHWGLIIFQHNHTGPWSNCLILAESLQLSWQKSGSSILIAVELVTSQVLLHWPKNNSPVGRASTIGWIFLKLPAAWLQQLLVSVAYYVGLHQCAPLLQYRIQMPQPSSMLIHFYILWLSQHMSVSTAFQLISSKMVNQFLIKTLSIQGTHYLPPLIDWKSERASQNIKFCEDSPNEHHSMMLITLHTALIYLHETCCTDSA